MQKLPLSVTIVAKNEADRIDKPILSVRDWADEVIVVDSGSTDDTVKFSESLGARVVYNAWKGFGFQKKFAAGLCKNDWVLNLDADEEVSPELREEILGMFARNDFKHSAYWVRISMVLPFEDKPHKWGNYVDIVRLYDRRKAASKEKDIYDEVLVSEGTTGRLNHVLYHRSFRGHAHEVEKINSYTTHHANDVFAKGRHIPAARILIEPFWAFLKCYFLKRYCIYGVDGFIQGVMYAFARTLRLAKVRELEQEKARKNKA